MSIMIDIPPAMAQEAQEYATVQGTTLERMLFDCIAAEIDRRRAAKKSLGEWEREFNGLVKQSEGRLAAPYKFNRADAYEEELA